jgi:hypothetical protein
MITQAPRHSGSRYIAADADDPGAYGPDGLLRDGFKIRVPITMMDASLPLQRVATVPRNISTGLTGKDSLDRYFFPDGSAKPARTPRAERQLPAADVDRYGANRPGFRDAASVRGVTDAGQAAKDSSYAEMCRDLQDAWKSPEQRTADARQVTDAACPAGVDPRDWAYHQRCQQDSEAWRTPAPVFDAAAVQNPPAGAYCKAGVGANAGDVCSWNGAPGNLVERDGWLFCEVHQPGPTRSGASSGRDAAVGDRSAQDQAWRQMVEDQQNAWRT